MPKKGKANNKSNNNRKEKAQEVPEDQTPHAPETPQTETPSEQQSGQEQQQQLKGEMLNTQEPQEQDLRQGTLQSAAELGSEEQLDQLQPTVETDPETDEDLASTNVDEDASAEPATKQPSVDSGQDHSETPQLSNRMGLDNSVPKVDGVKVSGEIDNSTTNVDDTNGIGNSVTKDSGNNIPEDKLGSTVDVQDMFVNSPGESTNGIPNDAVSSLENNMRDNAHNDTVEDSLLDKLDSNASQEVIEYTPRDPLEEAVSGQHQGPAQLANVTEPSEQIVQPAESIEPSIGHAAITEPTVAIIPVQSIETVEPVEPRSSVASTEFSELAEPAKSEPTVPAVPTEQAEISESTNHAVAEPAGFATHVDCQEAGSAKPTEPVKPVEQIPDIAPEDELSSPVPESASVTEAQATSHLQSGNLPTVESLASPISHNFPETKAAALAQPALSEPKFVPPRTLSPAQRADPFVYQTNTPTAPISPAQQQSSLIPQPTGFSTHTTHPVPIHSIPITRQTASQNQPFVSPLRPVQHPLHVSQATSLTQETVSSFPQSASSFSPLSKSGSLEQTTTSSIQRHGGHTHKNSSGKPFSPIQRFGSPIQKPAYLPHRAPSPAPKPASPALRAYSPLPRISNPLARPYHSPTISPRQTMPSQLPQPSTMFPGTFPSHVSGFGSALQSPVLNGGFFPPYTHSPYYANPPPQPHQQQAQSQMHGQHPQFSGYINPGYMPYRRDSMANGHVFDNKGFDGKGFDSKGHSSLPDADSDHLLLLQRIQDAIPDMGRLLQGYKSVKSKLMARETEIKQIQTQHEQSLMQKNFYIEALQNQLRKATGEIAVENNRLKNVVNEQRMELGNLEEKNKDLDETLFGAQNSNQQLSQWNVELECHVAKLENDTKEAQEAHNFDVQRLKDEHAEALAIQKRGFDETRAEDSKTHSIALETQEKQLLDQQGEMTNDYENTKQQMQDAHNALQDDFDSTVAELEPTQNDLLNARNDLDAKHKELEGTCEAHANEIDTMNNGFSEKQQEWDECRADLETQISRKVEELVNLEQERERLQEEYKNKEQQLQHTMEEMHTTVDNMDKDRDRLKKTLQSLGEAKSTKGDTFFLDCFEQLYGHITALSKDHFTYLPSEPPKNILSKVPSELPPFLDNTPASIELRSAYVQHIISKSLTHRIFQPFLFTLGRRYDNADIFLQMLSMDIRRKSTRREAFWRQQTLQAAYTAPDAKHTINFTAGVIADEIMDHIRHFADPDHLEALRLGVRRIVKLAAETWRHARVERELILATLPAPDAEGATNKDWKEYGRPKEGNSSSKNDPTRHVLLRIFPRITRDEGYEDFAGDEERRPSCTYSRGSVLYSDSPVVMARRQEEWFESSSTISVCGSAFALNQVV